MNSEYPIGLRVRLPQVEAPRNQPRPSEVGKYGHITGFERIEVFGHEVDTPVITLDDGTIIKGYECWWEPADDIEEEHA